MRDTGIEPVTSSVSGKRSPTELIARYSLRITLHRQPFEKRGADDETRTRDPHLGKVMRYQLRYIRIAPQTFIPLRCEKKHYRAPRQFPNPQPSALLLTADIPRLYVPKSHRCDSCGPQAPSRLPLMSSPTQPIRYLNFKRCTFSHRTVL